MYSDGIKVCTCVCVQDIFNEVSTRLVRQARLYDRFPQDPKPSELLKSTRTAAATSTAIPTYESAKATPLAHGCVKRLGRCVQSMTDINRYVRQYRGTQPHSTESTMTESLRAGNFKHLQTETIHKE